MKKTKKALATLAIAGMTLSMIPFNAFAASTVPTRIAGMTAEQTATKIADQTGYTGTAILASSTSYGMVDALTAGPLAASLKAPILLTGAGTTLNADTKAELTKLAVKKVYVTSGTAVIKQGVIDELKAMGIEVIALGGFDRAETSVNIAKQMTGVTKVAIANGVPDALSIASVASAANQPILLTNKNALPSSVADYLASASVTSTDVIGGTGVISDAVVAGLPGATRHFGMTAYDTNNQVIQDFAAALEFDNIYVANGQTGIDALAGAPLAAQTKSAIVLTDGKTVPAVAAFTHSKNASAVVTALGGTAVVPEAVRMGVAAGNVSTPVGDLAIVSVSSLTDDGRVLAVDFNKASGAINKSQVKIYNTKSLARVGVESVELSSDGMSLEVILYDTANAEEIVRAVEYTIEVGSLKFNFSRANYYDQDDNARITAVSAADREITLTADGVKEVLDVPSTLNVNFEEILNQSVRIWYDANNVVTKLEIQSTSFVDSIEYDADDAEITLKSGKATLDLADGFKFFLNDKSATIGADDVEKYDYAKVILNKDGDVAYIYAYAWDDFLVVDSIDGDVAISVDDSELDLEDFIVVKDGKQISISDINKGDILYFVSEAKDGDGFAVVYNKSITGEITDVFSTSIRIDGKDYTFTSTRYLDGDKLATVDPDVAKEFKAGGSVTVFLNHKGDAVFISGDQAAVASNKTGFHLTEAAVIYQVNNIASRGTMEIEGVNGDGDEKSYSIRLDSLDKITDGTKKYEVDKVFPSTNVKIDKFALANNGTIVALNADSRAILADGTLGPVYTSGADWNTGAPLFTASQVEDNDFVEIETDDEGTIIGLEFIAEKTLTADEDKLKLEDKFLEGYKLMASTVVFDVTAGSDADDIVVTTWGALAGKGFKISVASYYTNTDNEVEYLVINMTDAETTTDVNAVVTKVLRNTKEKIVEITAFVDGVKKTYQADELDLTLDKGDLVTLQVNDDNGVVEDVLVTEATTFSGLVTDVSVANRTVTIEDADGNEKTYTLVSDGSVINAKDVSDITVKALRDLKKNVDTVELTLTEGVPASSLFIDVVKIKVAE